MGDIAEITVVMPTYRRPDLAEYMVAHVAHRPFIIVSDEGHDEDLPGNLPSNVEVARCPVDCGAVKAAETGYLAAKTRLIVNLNDDMEFVAGESDNWLQEAARVYWDRLGGKDGVVAIRDGIQNGNIASFALFSRKFYLDHLFPSPYRAYYIDKEMAVKARALGVYHYAERSYVRHLYLQETDPLICGTDQRLYRQRMEAARALGMPIV